MVMLTILRHDSKALSPILVTELPSFTLAKLTHEENALLPMLSTELPITISPRNPEQFLNAESPIFVNVLGNFVISKELHPINA